MDGMAQPAGPFPGVPGDLRQRSNDVQRHIEELFFLILERRKAAAGVYAPLEAASLKLSLELAQAGTPEHASDQLYLQLQRAAERCVEKSVQIPLGRVFCHWCRSSFCEHSAPPEGRSVFGGYTATGQPVWPEFVSVLLELRDPRVDMIFRSTPTLVTVVQPGDELTSALLPIYGKGSSAYRILAQVVLGYIVFPDGLCLPTSPGVKRSPIALTLQAVDAGGSIVLNIIGRLPDGRPALQAFEESSDARLADAILSTRRSLEEVSLLRTSRRRRQGERKQRVLGILQRLARSLDRIFRQRQRRTHHSQDRHQHPGRPASTALRDALEAAPGSIYRDVVEKTWVVLGPKNRVHVFNDAALHVTSVVYPGETVHQRTTRGKWHASRPEEAAAFQETLRRRTVVE